MNLPAFSSDLILIKNALYQEIDTRYKGKVVSEAETKRYFSQTFGGKFLKILNCNNIFIFNCYCYGDFLVVVKQVTEQNTLFIFPKVLLDYRKHFMKSGC